MKQWFKSSIWGNRWWPLVAVSSSSGIIGYLASQWQANEGKHSIVAITLITLDDDVLYVVICLL